MSAQLAGSCPFKPFSLNTNVSSDPIAPHEAGNGPISLLASKWMLCTCAQAPQLCGKLPPMLLKERSKCCISVKLPQLAGRGPASRLLERVTSLSLLSPLQPDGSQPVSLF